ncbi:uncharacterized membrane protein HdeD (DUF308 family) [Roseimicrobium gellanilyticum]|uniref:Uncharacterized membrane protein HdeD (DUF308 family) n=1 Tax=Roseimicrobium gellanilyticum TaxID=748857 RepID=A0A366H2T7_9BACT|nr:HdeD family acid-resistance protein [Roseimicrobium gellanilyticum]RBP35362.1 uncharacterized membrane protein HdeD (DUF308 family) [Roseimicrobium gellanilyticum]
MKATLLHQLAQSWGWILLRGILAILFGFMAFAWPLITLQVLVILYGAYVFIDGVSAVIAAIAGGTVVPRWWLAMIGAFGIIAGLAVFFWPGITALVLLIFIGVTSIVRGIFEIIGAIALRKEISNEWMLALSGVASVGFGVIMVLFPGSGAIAMVWVIAVYAVAFGLLLTGLALRLRKHAHGGRPQPA